MNRRSLLGKLFGGAVSAVVVTLAVAADGKRKFVVPEKTIAGLNYDLLEADSTCVPW